MNSEKTQNNEEEFPEVPEPDFIVDSRTLEHVEVDGFHIFTLNLPVGDMPMDRASKYAKHISDRLKHDLFERRKINGYLLTVPYRDK